MSDESKLVVGLEIGTSKICAVVGEASPDGTLNIVGLGQAATRGVRKGEVVDAVQAEECVRHAIVEAEQMANVEIRNLYVGVTGAHIRGFNNRGVHRVLSADRNINEADVADVIRNARTVNLPAENMIIHDVRQHFLLDGVPGINSPVNMLGTLLEVDVHVVHGVARRMQNTVQVVKNLRLGVNEMIFNGLASALATLTAEQKEVGALALDMGGGTTEYVVYADGIIKHTGVFAIGGDHVSNDLAHGLKVTLSRAEKLKVEHGTAVVDEAVRGKTIALPNEMNHPVRSVNLEHLQRIMAARLDELLFLIRQDLEEEGLMDCLRSGVFICGGGARIPRITELAQTIFGVPAYIARSNAISGLNTTLDQPEFLTGIGLVRYGSMRTRKRPTPGLLDGVKDMLGRFLPQI